MKKEFVRLCNLLDITYDGETVAQSTAWKDNVMTSVGSEGYTYADVEGRYITKMFSCDEMQFADVSVYDFMGSEYEAERFYARDIVVFENTADGFYYVLNADDLGEF